MFGVLANHTMSKHIQPAELWNPIDGFSRWTECKTMVIRVWMRTASFGKFLSTLFHEFCHLLDFKKLNFADSWHTRGFYEKSRGSLPSCERHLPKRLVWAPMSRGRWRIDWLKTKRSTDDSS